MLAAVSERDLVVSLPIAQPSPDEVCLAGAVDVLLQPFAEEPAVSAAQLELAAIARQAPHYDTRTPDVASSPFPHARAVLAVRVAIVPPLGVLPRELLAAPSTCTEWSVRRLRLAEEKQTCT